MLKDISESLQKYGKEALGWLGWNIVGSLFPVWGGAFVFVLFFRKPCLTDFSNNGQFALYSAATLASAFYIVLKEYKTSIFSGRRFFGAICIIGLMLTTLLFSIVTAVDAGELKADIDRKFMRNFSLGIYAISLIIAFLLTALDNVRTRVDLEKERRKGLDELEKEVDELGE